MKRRVIEPVTGYKREKAPVATMKKSGRGAPKAKGLPIVRRPDGTIVNRRSRAKKVKKEVEVESIILMKFASVAQTNPYQGGRFPAINALSDENNTFSCTEKGKGMFWRGMFKNGAHVIT